MRTLRRVAPISAIVLALVLISVWAGDARGVLLAVILVAVSLAGAERRRRRAETGSLPPPIAHEPTLAERLLTGVVSLLVIAGIVTGGVVGWTSTHEPIAAASGAVMEGAAGLLVAGILASLGAALSLLVQRIRKTA